MSVIVLDAGNSMIKARIGRRGNCELVFPHAINQLSEAEYASILDRAGTMGLSRDYLCVNRIPFVVGKSAERHSVNLQRNGAARYIRDY